MMRFVWFLIFLRVIWAAHFLTYPRRKECGDNLERVLSMICNKIYNGPSKKAAWQPPYDDYDNKISYGGALDLYNNFKPREEDNSWAFMRRRRGIVEECCYQPCGQKELEEYCGK